MKIIELPPRKREDTGYQDLARFEVVDEETGELFGRVAVSSFGLEWRAPGMVGGRLMRWRNLSVTMTDSDEDKMERLVEDCGLDRPPATSLARSAGRCEYCGRDLLRDRFGYGTSTVDHLVPGRPSWEGAAECEWNWVFCCAPCSSAKGDWNPDEGTPVGSEDELLGRRKELIALTRAHVHSMLATKHVPDWFRVLGVMEERDTE